MKHTKEVLYQSEEEWLKTGLFKVGIAKINGNQIRYAITRVEKPATIVTMVGGIPRDPNRRKRLPLINKLYGLLALKLIEFNVVSIMYNQPATGGSGGDYRNETLESRSSTLAGLISHVGIKSNLTNHVVLGTSAGAYMAVKALENIVTNKFCVKKLILLSPAAYPAEAEAVPYGSKFTEIIRTPWDVADSPMFPRLENFVSNGGSVLISFFEFDNPPIPDFIQSYYREFSRRLNAQTGNVKLMTIPGVAHNFRRISNQPNDSAVDNNSIRTTASILVNFIEK